MDFIKWRPLAIELRIDPFHLYAFLNGKPHKLSAEKIQEVRAKVVEETAGTLAFIDSRINGGGMEC